MRRVLVVWRNSPGGPIDIFGCFATPDDARAALGDEALAWWNVTPTRLHGEIKAESAAATSSPAPQRRSRSPA